MCQSRTSRGVGALPLPAAAHHGVTAPILIRIPNAIAIAIAIAIAAKNRLSKMLQAPPSES